MAEIIVFAKDAESPLFIDFCSHFAPVKFSSLRSKTFTSLSNGFVLHRLALRKPFRTSHTAHAHVPSDFKSSISMKLSKVIRSAGVGGINSTSNSKCPFAISVTGFLSGL